jgi:hypothetical protein
MSIYVYTMSYYHRCTNCTSLTPKTKVADGTGPHGQKLVCAECEKFIRWLPKNTEPPAHVDTTRYHHRCTEWELKFLVSIAKQKTLSPKQSELCNKIVDKLSVGEYYGELK